MERRVVVVCASSYNTCSTTSYAIGMGTKEITLKPTAGKTLSLLLVFIVLGFSTAGFDLLVRRLLCSHLVLSLDWYTIHVLHIWYL